MLQQLWILYELQYGWMFTPTVKECIILEHVKPLFVAYSQCTLTLAYGSWSFFPQPLPFTFSPIHNTSHLLSLLVSMPLPLSTLLHCFLVPVSVFGFPKHGTAHWSSTQSQEHAVYEPTWFQHVVMISKSCAANKTVWSQVSSVRPEEGQFFAQASSYANVWFK